MSTKQLNIRRKKAAGAARELAKAMRVPISVAVEEALVAALGNLRRHVEMGGSPVTFRSELIADAATEPDDPAAILDSWPSRDELGQITDA
jgi:hypothetical protein